jgi:competence protein ComEC
LIEENLNESVKIVGIVKSDPVLKEGKSSGSIRFEDNLSFLINLKTINNQPINLPIRVKISTDQKVKLDQVIKLKVRLVKSKEKKVAALGISQGKVTILEPSRILFSSTEKIRSEFRNLADSSRSGQLVPGLVLGDTSLQSESFKEEMRKVGLSHLTAVSGANFVLVATFIFWILQFGVKRIRNRVSIVSIFLILFVFLVRPTPSVLRAFIMTSVLLVSKFKGEKTFGLASLGFAIMMLILFDPFQGIDPGFALSVLATAGILIMAPKIQKKFKGVIKPDWLLEGISIPISATIFCLPVILLLAKEISLATIPANILVAPVIAPITILGFVSALVTPFTTNLGLIFFFTASFLATYIIWVCGVMVQLPVLTFNNPIILILLSGLLIIILKKRISLIVIILSLFLSIQIFWSASFWPGRDWMAVNCDVGQGDGLVINLGKNSAIIIDTGPDEKAIDQCLNKLEIKNIPLLILTHFHFDHVGAVSAVRKGRSIGEVWISNLHEPVSSYEMVMKELNGLKVISVFMGQKYELPNTDTQVQVLWPDNKINEFKVLPGDGSKVNNSSISVIVRNRFLSIFAGGDIEPEAQERIVASKLLTNVDVLKVSHHGSAFQFLPMVEVLNPKVALISVGKGNSYGHPDQKFIQYLSDRGVKVWRTDLSGGISVSSTNKIRVTGKEWWRIRWG